MPPLSIPTVVCFFLPSLSLSLYVNGTSQKVRVVRVGLVPRWHLWNPRQFNSLLAYLTGLTSVPVCVCVCACVYAGTCMLLCLFCLASCLAWLW